MPIDPNIALSVKTPQPESPLTTIGGLMQLKDSISQIALRNAQTQQAQQNSADIQAQAQGRQRDLADQQAIQQAMTDPGQAKAIGAGDLSTLNGKIQPKSLIGLQNSLAELHKTKAANSEADLKNQGVALGRLEDTLGGLSAMRKEDGTLDIDGVNGSLPGAIQTLTQQGVIKDAGITTDLPTSITSEKDLQQMEARLGLLQGVNAKAADLKKTQTEGTKNTAQASEAQANADLAGAKKGGAQAESTRQQLITSMMQKAQSAQANGQHPIDAILGTVDPAAAGAYKPAYDSAMAGGGPEAAKAILEAAANHAGQLSMATNPQVRQAKVDEAVATEKATAPIKEQTAINTQRALYGGGNAAVAAVPPHLVATAIGDANKAGQDYAQAAGDAARIKDFVAAAQSGNKAAPGLIPLTELRGIVNRVNRNELDAISSSAGSAYDRVQGFFGKYTEGQSIPPAVLKDTASIADTMANAAQRTYGMKLNTINTNYGSKFEPVRAGGALPQVGDIVPTKSGKVKITAIHPDGTFDADPVKQ